MTSAILWILVVVIAAAAVIALLACFFKRAPREFSLVRTGIGGRKVVIDGGILAIPYFHEVSRVNMQTLRLDVSRAGDAALITKDRLRVDVGAEFYLSVIPTEEGIARAAQSLGKRTFHAEQLGDLIEGKLLDALRSVAARLTMDELHENRDSFVNQVQESLKQSLSHNGLELDSVSLSSLDQTAFSALDENNVFNAVGMRRLAEVVAKSKKERAEIDADAEVSVRRASMEATKLKLQIDLEEQEAEIEQVQQIEVLRAAQLAEVARRKAESEREAARARIQMEQEIRSADIARDRSVREAEIARDKELQEAEIAGEREIEIARQERQIAVANSSQEESRAQAAADEVRADARKAAEAVTTAQRLAEAERNKRISIVEAEQQAEISGLRMRFEAKAERDSAEDLALAKAIQTKADAEALERMADARRKDLLARAEGEQAVAAAENTWNESIVALKMNQAKLDALPKLVAEMVKPMEKVDSFKVHQISGLGSGAGSAGDVPSTAVNQLLDGVMNMAVQMPALKKIGEELGLEFDQSFGTSRSGPQDAEPKTGEERSKSP
jgi:uncharacterized membrane protein YqiK